MRQTIGRNAILTALTVSALMAITLTAAAQAGGSASAEIKQKVMALKQSVAANQQRLRKYQWTEVQQLTLKGDSKPQQQFMCQYGPDGKVEKYPTGPQEQPSGGRLKQKMIAKKKAEMQDYMAECEVIAGHVHSTQSAEDAASFGHAQPLAQPGRGVGNRQPDVHELREAW